MDATQYPVTYEYGRTDPPYGTAANPYHRGQDRFMPVGTAVKVNGLLIGYSGQTGFVTGPHLHVGRFVNGRDTNPNGGGFSLKTPATVADVGYDEVNGNYVAINDADGVRWVYLHLSSQTVSAGQVINQGEVTMSPDALNLLAQAAWNRPVNGDDSFVKGYKGKAPEAVLTDVLRSAENVMLRTKAANYDAVVAALNDAYRRLDAAKSTSDAKQVINDVESVLDKYK